MIDDILVKMYPLRLMKRFMVSDIWIQKYALEDQSRGSDERPSLLKEPMTIANLFDVLPIKISKHDIRKYLIIKHF